MKLIALTFDSASRMFPHPLMTATQQKKKNLSGNGMLIGMSNGVEFPFCAHID